ncbi:MAG TPA: sigma-54 dependent transcriptional regulator [Phycisphaerae bacterium]|jgi:DNA-binding NtrC family response regulator
MVKPRTSASILIVDDEAAMREGLAECLRPDGYDVHTCGDVASAQKLLGERVFDLVITDLVMEPRDGMELLEWVQERRPETAVIMITGYSTVATAVEAMRKGAFDYIAKPFRLDEVRMTVERAVQTTGLQRENRQLRRQLDAVQPQGRLIGESAVMRSLLALVDQVAASDVPVLITGETGTGKELLARELHRRSQRVDRPFLTVNCAALPETLLESELFGHVKGAFTGAAAEREGLFQAAHGGTLFLDEIGDISPPAQARLLRVLQDGEIRRIGENTARYVDVRIIAATNQNLAERIRAKSFREDLYFRLNVVTLSPPPLRERREDVPLLAEQFLESCRHERGLSSMSISPEALAALKSYDWPGNVRELENVMRRAAVICQHPTVGVADLPPELRSGARRLPENEKSLEAAEQRHIVEVLRATQGNLTHAARMLGISRPTLRAKIKNYGIDRHFSE